MARALENKLEASAQVPPIADWLEALGHDGPFERQPAAVAWNRVAPPLVGAVRRLIPLLKDADVNVRRHGVEALGNLGGQAHWILGVLRAALKSRVLEEEDDELRNLAMHALLLAGPQATSEVAGLTDSLQDDVEVVRFHAAIALGDLGCAARPSVPALIRTALWDENPAVRVEAAVALWKIDRKGPLVIPALIKALANNNEFICWMAADGLGQIGPEARQAVPALQQALRRPFKIALIRKGVELALQRIDPQAADSGGLLPS